MKLFLNNLIKGLMTALVVICLGGFISLNISVPSTPAMFLVSSSLINAINTNSSDNIGDGIVDDSKENLVEENQDEVIKQEVEEEKVEIKEESIKEENNNTDSNDENNVVQDNKNEEENNLTDKESNSNDNSNTNLEKEETVVQGEYNPNLEVVSTIEAIETYHGKMTGYGPDCYGCSGITASGMNVLNGNIYYNDNTFGNIRIVAGDKSIPFGSIIKITGTSISSDPIIAIVLDRGGMIGFQEGKHSYFDLLFESEQASLFVGRQDATFELLRRGY